MQTMNIRHFILPLLAILSVFLISAKDEVILGSVSGLFYCITGLFQEIYLPIYNEMEFDTLIRILDPEYIKSRLGI